MLRSIDARRIVFPIVALALVVVSGCGGKVVTPVPTTIVPTEATAVVAKSTQVSQAPTATPLRATPTIVKTVPVATTPGGTLSVVDAVARVRPAVVNITTQVMAYDFWQRVVPSESGVGSGVIIDKQGLILTNNHVIEDADTIKVILPDGRSFDGKVVGAHPRTDLAVVRVSATDLPVAELGDSSSLVIGESVVAIGNALALPGGPTVTAGIVGALGRSITTDSGNTLYDLIQTDAAINPGNSGGALIDLTGKVVGINTAIAEAPGGGIGFAISIDAAKPIMAELISQGRVRRAWLGAELRDVTSSLAAQYRLQVKQGVMLTSIYRNSPAAKSGLRAGDVIVAMDDEQINDSAGLLKGIAKRGIGAKTKVTYYRSDQKRTADVTLEEMPNY